MACDCFFFESCAKCDQGLINDQQELMAEHRGYAHETPEPNCPLCKKEA